MGSQWVLVAAAIGFAAAVSVCSAQAIPNAGAPHSGIQTAAADNGAPSKSQQQVGNPGGDVSAQQGQKETPQRSSGGSLGNDAMAAFNLSSCCHEWRERCTPGPVEEDSQLPLYLMILAVEGSGHHAFHSVFRLLQMTGNKPFMNAKPVKLIAIEAELKMHGFEFPARKFASVDSKQWLEQNFIPKLRKAVPGYGTAYQPDIVTDDADSFPMSQLPMAISHPDVVYWLRYVDGKYFRMRFIVLYREPVMSPMSALRRFQKHHPRDHMVRQHEHGFMYINSLIPKLPCGRTLFVRSEDFVSDPESFADPLYMLLPSLDIKRLRHALKTAVRRKDQAVHEKKYQQSKDFDEIDSFFKERENLLWPRLAKGPRPYGILTHNVDD